RWRYYGWGRAVLCGGGGGREWRNNPDRRGGGIHAGRYKTLLRLQLQDGFCYNVSVLTILSITVRYTVRVNQRRDEGCSAMLKYNLHERAPPAGHVPQCLKIF
ncbi:hypothetical protein GDO81_019594, partial [Engystomops pustulosus]